MEDHKADAKVFDVEVFITNSVTFRVKCNDQVFLRQWLAKQLGPITQTSPPGASIEIQVYSDPIEQHEVFQAEVYGTPETGESNYEVLEHVKNEIFERGHANS